MTAYPRFHALVSHFSVLDSPPTSILVSCYPSSSSPSCQSHQMSSSIIRVSLIPTSSFHDDESQSSTVGPCPYNSKVLLAAVISLSAAVFFVLLLHVYARCFLRRCPAVSRVVGEPLWRESSLAALQGFTTDHEMITQAGDGLDAKAIALLPAFVFKAEEHERGVLDCVVCLSVMEEGEKGRMLPGCKHAFHVDCIDMWLMSHSNCPLCRAPVKMDEPSSSSSSSSSLMINMSGLVAVSIAEDGSRSSGNEEDVNDVSREVAIDVSVEATPLNSTMPGRLSVKEEESSPSSSPSMGYSLKRMLTRSRSESRVFPSNS